MSNINSEIETALLAETEPSQTVPVHGVHENNPGWLEQQREKLFKYFAESPEHAGEFEKWQEKNEAKARIQGQFQSFSSNLESARLNLSSLVNQIESSINCDLAASIYNFVKNNGGERLQVVARDNFIASAAILKSCGPAIVQLAKADVAVMEKQFDRFKSENKAVLKELGLI